MAKTIITQDGDLVNYANIIAVTVGDATRHLSNEKYVLVAYDTMNEELPLGFYPTYEKAREAEKNLAEWLNNEAFGVYRLDSEVI